MVEGDEDCTEEGCRLITGIWLELRVDVDDESRADCREQTGLENPVRRLKGVNREKHTKIKVVLRSSSYFLT
jgi:hypothetical protein